VGRYSVATTKLLNVIAEYCVHLGLKNQVRGDTLELSVRRYQNSFHMSEELHKCLVWCKDKGHRIVTTARINNWFSAAHKRAQQARREHRAPQQPRSAPDAVQGNTDVRRDLEMEQREKVQKDTRLQDFLQQTATSKSMPDVSEAEVRDAERNPTLFA